MVKIMENPIKMDDLGVPLFLETPIWQRFQIQWSFLVLVKGDWGSDNLVIALEVYNHLKCHLCCIYLLYSIYSIFYLFIYVVFCCAEGFFATSTFLPEPTKRYKKCIDKKVSE